MIEFLLWLDATISAFLLAHVNPNYLPHGYYISTSNKKTGNIASFSLPPFITCNPLAPCFIKCYAYRHIYAPHKEARDTYDLNMSLLLMRDPEFKYLVSDISEYVKFYRVKSFRWHVSGDVYSVEYGKAIIQIAYNCPECHFALLTKQYENMDSAVKAMGKPSNLNVCMSCWDDFKPSAEIMSNPLYTFNYFKDKKGTIVNPDGLYQCPGSCKNCKVCFNGKANVEFHEH